MLQLFRHTDRHRATCGNPQGARHPDAALGKADEVVQQEAPDPWAEQARVSPDCFPPRIAATEGGSLVEIVFHVLPGVNSARTAVQLVDRAVPGGQQFTTQVGDAQEALVLGSGSDQILIQPSGLLGSRLGDRPRVRRGSA
jgi:hypothetical protein